MRTCVLILSFIALAAATAGCPCVDSNSAITCSGTSCGDGFSSTQCCPGFSSPGTYCCGSNRQYSDTYCASYSICGVTNNANNCLAPNLYKGCAYVWTNGVSGSGMCVSSGHVPTVNETMLTTNTGTTTCANAPPPAAMCTDSADCTSCVASSASGGCQWCGIWSASVGMSGNPAYSGSCVSVASTCPTTSGETVYGRYNASTTCATESTDRSPCTTSTSGSGLCTECTGKAGCQYYETSMMGGTIKNCAPTAYVLPADVKACAPSPAPKTTSGAAAVAPLAGLCALLAIVVA